MLLLIVLIACAGANLPTEAQTSVPAGDASAPETPTPEPTDVPKTPEPDVVSLTASPVPSPAPTVPPTPEPVVFQSGASFAPEETAIRTVVTADELTKLDAFSSLRSLDLSGSVCYAEILAWAAAHPDVSVRYTVPLDGEPIASDAAEATVSRVADPTLLAYLPALKTLTVKEPLSPDAAAALTEARPDLVLSGSVKVGSRTIPTDVEELDARAIPPSDAEALAKAIPALSALTRIDLRGTDWTLDQADLLQRAKDGVLVDYEVTAFGRTFSLADEVVNFNKIRLREKVDEVRALLPYLRNVKRLDMEDCRIPDEVMAELREEFPQPKIVWRIHCGGYYSARTDSIMVRFSFAVEDRRLTDAMVAPIKYCNELRYLDLGHNKITKTDFLAYMPDLEVVIVAVGPVEDISAVANCPKLEYCEFLSAKITDISALANCTELEHLNLALNKITDISPLYGLKKLKRLWISRNPIPQEQIDHIRELLPDCVINTTSDSPTGEGWRYVSDRTKDQPVERYLLLCNQFYYGHPVFEYTEETRPTYPD